MFAMGDYKIRNETETKQTETKRNETKRDTTETKQDKAECRIYFVHRVWFISVIV